MLEALVYTQNREVELRSCEALVDLPVDWTMLRDLEHAREVFAGAGFNFVIVDVDTHEGRAVVDSLLAEQREEPPIVLAVSRAAVDATLLLMCYRAQFYYPIRPRDISEMMQRAVLFVQTRREPAAVDAQSVNDAAPQEPVEAPVVFGKDAINLGAAIIKTAHLAKRAWSFMADMFRMKHSLSIVAHERIASLIVSLGMMWYVQEITSDFVDIASIDPPSAGPTYLIAVALLLWLCAKSRRARAELKPQPHIFGD